jgi:hypothetical protein
MADNIFAITCPANCESAGTLPVIGDQCQLAPVKSEIYALLFMGTDAGPADAAVAGDWAGLIDNTDATGANIKYLIGSGTIAEAAKNTVTVAKQAVMTIDKTFTLVFTVTDLSQAETYDFCRQLECGALKPPFMYADLGGYLYYKKVASTGTDKGVTPLTVDASFTHEAGEQGILKCIITITWKARTNPDRCVFPLTLPE